MATRVGAAYVSVSPTFTGFKKAVSREVTGSVREGRRGFTRGFRSVGQEAGDTAGRGFARAFGRGGAVAIRQETRGFEQAVGKAASAMATARRREMDAAGQVRIAEARLADARKKHSADSVQVVRAEEQLASAKRRLEDASEKARVAADKLAVSQKQLADAQRATQQSAGGFRQSLRDLASGFRDSNAAASSFTGIAGTIGGRLRQALQPALNAVSNLRTGFSSAGAEAPGIFGRIGSAARTMSQPMLNGLKQLTDGWRSQSTAASTFGTGLGAVGGMARRFTDNLVLGFRDSNAAASSFTGVAGTIGGIVQRATGVAQRAFSSVSGVASRVASRIGGAWQTVAPAFSSMASGIGSVWDSAMSGLQSMASAALDGIKTAFTVAGIAISAVLATSLGAGWGRATSIENAQAKLRGLGRDAEEIESIMDSALQSVDGTMFGLGEAATTAAGAVAAGVEQGQELTDYLTRVANAAAATGRPMEDMGALMNNVRTTQRAYLSDLNQVARSGLPIYKEIAAELGVTEEEVRKMASSGQISFEQFEAAVERAAGTVADEMGNTVQGTLANLRGDFAKLGEAILTPLFPAIRSVLNLLREGFGAAKDIVAPIMESIGVSLEGGFIPAVERITEKIAAFRAGLAEGLGGFDLSGIFDGLSGFAPILGAVAGALLPMLKNLPLVGKLFAGLSSPITIVVGAIAGLLMVSEPLREAVSGALEAIGGALQDTFAQLADSGVFDMIASSLGQIAEVIGAVLAEAITAVVPVIVKLIESAAGLTPIFAQLWPVLAQIADVLLSGLMGALEPLLPVIGQVAESLLGGLMAALEAILPSVLDLVPVIVQLAETAGGVLASAMGALAPVIAQIAELAGQLFQQLAPVIGQLIEAAIPILGLIDPILQLVAPLLDLVAVILPPLLSLLSPLIDLFMAILVPVIDLAAGLVELLMPAIEWIVEAIGTLIGWIVQGIEWLVNLATGSGESSAQLQAAFEAAKRVVQIALSAIGGFLRDAWNTVVSIFSGIGNFFRDAWNNAVSAIRSGVNTAVSVVTGLGDRIWSAVTGIGRRIYNGGRAIIQSLIDGIKSMLGAVSSAVGGVMDFIGGFFPSSPAKRGRFSGSGWTGLRRSGQALQQQFLDGLGDPRVEFDVAVRGSRAVGSDRRVHAGTSAVGGPAVFNLYDADGQLIGRMRGEAKGVVDDELRDGDRNRLRSEGVI